MAGDIVFKSKAFGGFDKEQVMDFVNQILAEKKDLEKRIAESNSRFVAVNAELNQYKTKAEECDSLNAQLEETKAQADELIEKINVLENENNKLQEKLRLASEKAVSDDVLEELEAIRGENARLKIELEKKKDLERQVGAAMLDARVHSESLIEDAKAKADAVTKAVYLAIGDTALRIDDLSNGIGEIARNFQKSVDEVELRIKALTGDMSKSAQLLISESNAVTGATSDMPATEYDFSTTAGSVDEADDTITVNPEDYDVDVDFDFSDEDYSEE